MTLLKSSVIGQLLDHTHDLWVAIFKLIITLLSLMFSERSERGESN